MNLLQQNKFVRVALVTFAITFIYWGAGFYLLHLLPYPYWFKAASNTYTVSLYIFFGFVVLANLYSVIAFTRAKWKRKEIHPMILTGPAISLTILFVFALKPYIPKILPSGSHLQQFDSELWIADDSVIANDGITPRQKMVGDAVDHVLPGKTRNEIIRLLGLSSDDSNQATLNYYLGPARGDFPGMHVEFLKVHFDPSGHYEKPSVVVDD